MKLPKEVQGFIEYELSHYCQYQEMLAMEREKIMDSSPAYMLHNSTSIGKPSEKKAIQLMTSMAIVSLERVINAVDRVLSSLGPDYYRLFQEYYLKGRRDYILLCMDLGVSKETFYRYKKQIIIGVGSELGYIK